MCGTPEAITPGGAIAVIILNFLFFPLGTWVHACMSENYMISFCNGIAQCILFIIFPPFTSIIAWAWGIFYGFSIYNKSVEEHKKRSGGFLRVDNNTQQNVTTTINLVQQPQMFVPNPYNGVPMSQPPMPQVPGYNMVAPPQVPGYQMPPPTMPGYQMPPPTMPGYQMPPQPMGFAPTPNAEFSAPPGYPYVAPNQPSIN